MDTNHLLQSYLDETLPTLGLDSDTYSPYVIACLDNGSVGGDGQGEVEVDEEELNEIMELLRASSESHSDDGAVWDEMKSEVLRHHKDYQKILVDKKNAALDEMKKV